MTDTIAEAPAWLVEIIRSAKRPHKVNPATPVVPELDTPAAIDRAVEWLEKHAPIAVEGQNGDPTTLEVACVVGDFGLSESAILDAMLDHWNERCSPPWDPGDLAEKVANSFKYRTMPIGWRSALADFDDVSESLEQEKKGSPPPAKGRLLLPGRVDLSRQIPPRRWLYGRKILAKYVAMCASPGGVGKTSWALTVALACASGQKLIHDAPHHAMRVWYYNLEDDIDEMHRRFMAAFKAYDLPDNVLDNIRVNSGRDRGLKLVAMQDDQFVVQPDAKRLTEAMRDEKIELLIVDPFLRSHGVKENDNEAQDEVLRVYADVGERTDAGIMLLHHVKKGAVAGDQDSLRGGSTQSGGARTVLTMSVMNADEAKAVGIDESRRRSYVRIDDAKRNMSPPSIEAEWIRLASVRLGNGTEDYPMGDDVQVVEQWRVPKVADMVDEAATAETMAAIDAGMDDGERYSARSQDKDRWAGTLMIDMLQISENEAGALLKEWLASGALEVRAYRSPTQRKNRQGLFRKERTDGEDTVARTTMEGDDVGD